MFIITRTFQHSAESPAFGLGSSFPGTLGTWKQQRRYHGFDSASMASFPFATRIQQTNAAHIAALALWALWQALTSQRNVTHHCTREFIQEIYRGIDSNPNSSRITCAWEFGFTPWIVQFIAGYNCMSASPWQRLWEKTAVDAWIRLQLALPHTCSSCHVNGSMVWKQWAKSRSRFLFIVDHCKSLQHASASNEYSLDSRALESTALSFWNISWALHLQNDVPMVQVQPRKYLRNMQNDGLLLSLSLSQFQFRLLMSLRSAGSPHLMSLHANLRMF